MNPVQFDKEILSRSLAETEKLAARFFNMIGSGGVVALYGPLGGGKTSFVRGVARAAGFDPTRVSSPSFTLINEYIGGQVPIFHFDLYRLKDPSELYSIGGDEYFARDGIILIEWADNGNGYLPGDRFNIHFEIIDENCRQLIFSKTGL